MNMEWYKLSLRKHMLRVDMKLYPGESENFNNTGDLDATIKSIITAAVIQGLDVIGIVSNLGPEIGILAQKIAKENQYDIWTIPGQEYKTKDEINLIIYHLKEPMEKDLDYNTLLPKIKQLGGFAMITRINKRQANSLNKLKGTATSPNAVEIYCGNQGGFQDLGLDYPKFITSGATSSKDLDRINAYTLISRPDFEAMGMMPQGEGSEYVPNYISKSTEETPIQGGL